MLPEIDFTRLDDRLYLSACDDDRGCQLWRTDGTRTGTRRVKDIRPGPMGSDPFGFTRLGKQLLFQADDGVTGIELWRLRP